MIENPHIIHKNCVVIERPSFSGAASTEPLIIYHQQINKDLEITQEKTEKFNPVKIFPNINDSLEEYLKQVKEYDRKRPHTTYNYRIK